MNTLGNRRGISTIVGAFFFVVIMIGAFAAIFAAFQLQENLIITQLDLTERNMKNLDENFIIAPAFDSSNGNRLCISVKNTGTNPVEIADIWIINKTDPFPAKRFEVDFKDAFIPISSDSDVVGSKVLNLIDGTYDIKVVSKSGTIRTTELDVVSSTPDPRLVVETYSSAPSINNGDDTIFIMHVYNRGNTTLTDVQPNGIITASPASFLQSSALLSPSSVSRLEPNEDAVFTWKNNIQGAVGASVALAGSAKAKVAGCDGSSFITSNTDTTNIFVARALTEKDLFAKPEIFASSPSPFGSVGAGQEGHFGMVVMNPTNQNMDVYQVALQVIVEEGKQVFKDNTITGIKPTTDWEDSKTLLNWKNFANPITIPPHSAEEWIAKIQPVAIEDLPINSLVFNAYTSFGQYSKGTIDTFGISKANAPIVEVYQSGDLLGIDRKYLVKGILSNSTKTYNVTIANTGQEQINSDSFLLLTVPPVFANLVNTTIPTGLEPQQKIIFDDGSQQIPLKLTLPLTSGLSRTYAFTATAPTVEETTMYLFTLTATGSATDAVGGTHIIGSVGQTIVQICPDPTCP
ncbi:hypothetical protein [Nitrosopumilus sp. b2]|uniref:hypothetical protein n=1 Tax=Nitrosopumilus sp. b2 TaxID=2109908 RepID=UPI0015F6403F|nr:hypothetical protein [Nitrosopumilus sp. b2]KAF6244992.1 hypothetical protein C6989_05450 [Nitrosopumilus sp. b2]